MTDEAVLRAAVLAAPDDDTPRLAYADWCDDAGDAARAEFIRAQIEAARAEPWSPAARAAEARAEKLFNSHGESWKEQLVDPRSWGGYQRGFVEGVNLAVEGFAERLAAACSTEPIRVVQTHRGGVSNSWDDSSLDSVFACEQLAQLVRMVIEHGVIVNSVEFDRVVECPHLSGLEALELAYQPVPPDWLVRFLASDHLPQLSGLDLTSVPNLGPALATGLTAARHRRFTELEFHGVRFLSGEIQRVLSSPAIAAVEDLGLGWAYAGPGPLTMLELGWVLPWAKLRRLDLSGQQLGPDGVKEITRRRDAAGLRWLGLARNHLGAAGAEWLLESPHLRLYHLDVSQNDIPAATLAALRARFPEAVVVG